MSGENDSAALPPLVAKISGTFWGSDEIVSATDALTGRELIQWRAAMPQLDLKASPHRQHSIDERFPESTITRFDTLPGATVAHGINNDFENGAKATTGIDTQSALNYRPEGSSQKKLSAALPPGKIAVGAILRFRYVLQQTLWRDASSLVVGAQDLHRAASHAAADSGIAIKILLAEHRGKPHALIRLKREFRQMQSLTHPGIARVFDLDRDGDVWFMTMEQLAGRTINTWLRESVSRADALQVIEACSAALTHAHSHGVVHGDLKSTNVLITNEGGIKLINFGCMSISDECSTANSGSEVAPPPCYASPQVLNGSAPEARDDVFSLACLSYEILSCGEYPFGLNSSLHAYDARMRPPYAASIPLRLFEVITRGLAWEREQRPASVQEFLHDLLNSELSRPLLTDKSLQSPPASESSDALNAAAASQPFVESVEAELSAINSPATVQASSTEIPNETEHSTDDVNRAASMPSITQPEADRLKSSNVYYLVVKRFGAPVLAVMLAVQILGAASLFERAASDESPRTTQSLQLMPSDVTDVVTAATGINPVQSESRPAVRDGVSGNARSAPSARGMITFDTAAIRVGVLQPLIAIPVKRLQSTQGSAKFQWAVEGGTAQPGIDYEHIGPQVASFIEGQAIRSLFIPLISRQNTPASRGIRTLTVVLRRVTHGTTLGPIHRLTVTIASP